MKAHIQAQMCVSVKNSSMKKNIYSWPPFNLKILEMRE